MSARRSSAVKRNVLFAAVAGKVPLRPAETKPGERPYLVTRLGLNRTVLLEAGANAAGCVFGGSGGRSWIFHSTDFIDIEMRYSRVGTAAAQDSMKCSRLALDRIRYGCTGTNPSTGQCEGLLGANQAGGFAWWFRNGNAAGFRYPQRRRCGGARGGHGFSPPMSLERDSRLLECHCWRSTLRFCAQARAGDRRVFRLGPVHGNVP